ncbi:FAD-binding oxidoreductase [Nonomuraea typhae]|uniref:FAD-binding oxidoreductase n=1 Tax=Nonomuraea typhae TaxID=2603600 RepID=UPI0012FAFE6D|nr:FAD-binding oxidoreductase [Nonomuraea typhae]
MARRITPESDIYDSERLGYQRSSSHKPDLIFPAETAADVREAVAHAAAHDLPVAVQATGHGLARAAEGGVLITTGRLNAVHVNPQTRTAHIEAGAPWSTVIEAAAVHGLAPLSGSAPAVGAASYTLGGGIGLMARTYGYAADHVRAVDVVTADGESHVATPDHDADLYWAMLGGRGAIGIATSLEIDLVPVTTLYGGALLFDTFDAVHAWREWLAHVPEEMTSSVAVIPFPDGRRRTQVRIAYLGEDGDSLIAPLRRHQPLTDTVKDIPYTATATIHNDPTEPAAYQSSHTLLRELPAEAVEVARNQTTNVVEIRHLGGALSRPVRPNAIGNRDAHFLYGIVTRGPEVPPVHEKTAEALEEWSTGGHALNFLYAAHATPEAVRTAFDPETYQRLRALKATYDPADLFRHTHVIEGP